ncbi:hypothetical protein ACPRNU_16240 [Chromobacterium vaccinii]
MFGPDRFELSGRLWEAISRAEVGRDSAAVHVCQLIQRGDEENARWMLEKRFQPASARREELVARVSALVRSWKEELEQPR